MSSIDRYRELAAKVDGFFDRVRRRYAAQMQCATGCSDCCRSRFSVTGVEAAVIEELLGRAEPELRERLAARARDGDPSVCAALDDSGACEIYEARPLVCRSHGVPIRSRRDSLPVIDCCPLNFAGELGPGGVDPDAVLDQETLSTVLMAVDMAFAEETGAERGERIELAELLQRSSE